jgi:hypothetical protein
MAGVHRSVTGRLLTAMAAIAIGATAFPPAAMAQCTEWSISNFSAGRPLVISQSDGYTVRHYSNQGTAPPHEGLLSGGAAAFRGVFLPFRVATGQLRGRVTHRSIQFRITWDRLPAGNYSGEIIEGLGGTVARGTVGRATWVTKSPIHCWRR